LIALRITVDETARCSPPLRHWNNSGIGGTQTFSNLS
jgi:hypothetical protein